MQARTVVRSSRETSGSMMASTSIVPARAADRRGMRTREEQRGRKLRNSFPVLWATQTEKRGSSFALLALQFLKAELETLPWVMEKGRSLGLGTS